MSPRFNSIRQKLQAIVFIATLTALVFALVGNVAVNILAFHRGQVEDLDTQSELLGRMTAPALSFDDTRLASDNLALLEVRKNIRAAAIYDENGKLFAKYSAPGHEAILPLRPGSTGTRRDGADLIVFQPIMHDGKLLGTIYLRAGFPLADLVVQSLAVASLIGLFAMAIAFLLIGRMERLVTRPIAEVARTARDVVERRDYSRRVEKRSNDEVGELVDSFNDMLQEVERGTAEVLRLNASLEQRVSERTAALEESNRQLTATKAAADEANQAKSIFLATMSHEIRTPMNGVIGMVDVLHQTSLTGNQVEMVDLIRESAFSLLTIIDDILDFSKIEAGRLEIEAAPISLSSVIEKSCAMLDHFALKKDVECTVFVDPRIPESLMGDALRLRQVMANLISNAIKFSSGENKRGRVSVRALLVDSDRDAATVEIHVIDDGIGIDAATQARLFTAFSQADTSTTRRFGGTGLGLAISRHLVDLMGGQIGLRSEPGKGADFSVRIRLPTLPAPYFDSVPEVDLRGAKCLIIGSAGDLTDAITIYLAHAQARVERVEDLESARSLMPSLPPGDWLWIIDAPERHVDLDVLRSITNGLIRQNVCFIEIGRGSRREPRFAESDLVVVDGNALTRRRLLRAAAIGLGRASEEPLAPQPGKIQGAIRAPSHTDARLQGRLILVAEDNETNQKVILRQLALLGFAADVAANGRIALELWRSGHYALVLTDIHMPEMDGYELSTAIRAQEGGTRRTPIVALTANALKGEADRCKDAGMDSYLTKPLQLADLQAALEAWLPLPRPDLPAGLHDGKVAQREAVDLSVLESLVGCEADIVDGFLREFQQSANKTAQLLISVCVNGDAAATSAQAHSLKSAARTIGALELGDLCAQMETAGKAGSAEMLLLLLPAFRSELSSVNAHLDRVLARRPTEGAA